MLIYVIKLLHGCFMGFSVALLYFIRQKLTK